MSDTGEVICCPNCGNKGWRNVEYRGSHNALRLWPLMIERIPEQLVAQCRSCNHAIAMPTAGTSARPSTDEEKKAMSESVPV